MHYHDTYRNTVRFFFTVNITRGISFGTKVDANLGILSCQVLFHQPLHTSRPQEELESTVQNTFFLRASRLSRSASIRVHVEVLNGLTSNNNNSQ